MLAELKSIYEVKSEWSQQLSQIAELNNQRQEEDKKQEDEVLDPEAEPNRIQDLKTIMKNLQLLDNINEDNTEQKEVTQVSDRVIVEDFESNGE